MGTARRRARSRSWRRGIRYRMKPGAMQRRVRWRWCLGFGDDDFVLALLSGGGSALWSAPLSPLTLQEKQAITRALVLSSASIDEINCVRKHLSAIKGGRLAAAAYPARVLALAISDVAGDDPSVIASGPTVGDPTTCADAAAILSKYGVPVRGLGRVDQTRRSASCAFGLSDRCARRRCVGGGGG